jgi:hypothetical protein
MGMLTPALSAAYLVTDDNWYRSMSSCISHISISSLTLYFFSDLGGKADSTSSSWTSRYKITKYSRLFFLVSYLGTKLVTEWNVSRKSQHTGDRSVKVRLACLIAIQPIKFCPS